MRYKPNECVYGYEDTIEADGRVPGVVVGYSAVRVRVRMRHNSGLVDRAVNARSLILVTASPPVTPPAA